MASPSQTQRQIALFIAQYAAAQIALRAAATASGLRLLRAFDSWYVASAVAAFARQAAVISSNGQQHATGLATAYVANVVAAMRGTAVHQPPVSMPPLRNGADMLEVYTRPITQYQLHYARTGDAALARDMAAERMESLVDTDIALASRDAENGELKVLKVTGYRRVIHPELSAGGTCGLCIAASTRIYHVEELLPLHGRCKCTVAPIEGHMDPGDLINREDLDRLYREAGGTSAAKLKATRYKVNEHGEYGPVLNRHGDAFRGPNDLGKNDPVKRAKAELVALQQVLTVLEGKQGRGVNVAGPLQYQRQRIAMLQAIVDQAA